MAITKGILVAIGGAEDKGPETHPKRWTKHRVDFMERGILRQVLNLVERIGKPRIELITTASSIPDTVERIYRQAFGALGCEDLGHLYITRREQADDPAYLERVDRCNCLLFSGGDQLRLSTVLGGTRLMSRVQARYMSEALVIAGTSAGAMAMTSTMIYDGSAARAHLKGEVKFTTGFGFVRNLIIDTHFEKRGRFNRLAQAVAIQPGILGIGIAEDTGVIISPAGKLEIIGSGIVTIVNGKTIQHTNMADIGNGMPFSVNHMVVHILAAGEIYNVAALSASV